MLTLVNYRLIHNQLIIRWDASVQNQVVIEEPALKTTLSKSLKQEKHRMIATSVTNPFAASNIFAARSATIGFVSIARKPRDNA